MVQSLTNLSLVTLARQFWDNNRIRLRFMDILKNDLHHKRLWTSAAIAYGSQVKLNGAPARLEDEFKLALLELGKRKYAKERTRVLQELPTEPPPIRALQEFLPEYYVQPDAIISVPALRHHFPDELVATAFNFLLALVLTNPRDDPSAIRECWTSLEFYQSAFIENFGKIWHDVFTGLMKERLRQSDDWREKHAIGLLKDRVNKDSFRCQTVDNETIPWFVFEVLSEEQRDKFLALGRSDVMDCRMFRTFFASIFKHWPWQNEAFDRYFEGRDVLSDNEIFVLVNVNVYQRGAEGEAIKAGMLPKTASFHHRVDNFLKEKLHKLPTK